MATGRFDSDVVVIGGGPGGSAAAITCASTGLRVRLLERQAFPADRPGETLHPGVESVLAQLGVADRLPAVIGSRHEGIRIQWGSAERFEPYGSDERGPWRGFQVWRADFDAMLLQRARELGVEIHQPCAAIEVLQRDGIVVGVNTSNGVMTAPVVIDASGRSHWLGSQLGIDRAKYSPGLIARYGYVQGVLPRIDDVPSLIGESSGWLWTALVRPGLYQWTRVMLDGTKLARNWRPEQFCRFTPVGPPRAADVSWQLSQVVAQPGWFQVGDAAAVLDPTSANGVLRALLSGITAGKLCFATVSQAAHPAEAAAVYSAWIQDWFCSAAERLAEFYRVLGIQTFGPSSDAEPIARFESKNRWKIPTLPTHLPRKARHP